MFGGLFKKKDNKMILGAPVKGKAVPLSEVNDPTFAEEIDRDQLLKYIFAQIKSPYMSYFNLFVSPLQYLLDKRKEMSKTSLSYEVSHYNLFEYVLRLPQTLG